MRIEAWFAGLLAAALVVPAPARAGEARAHAAGEDRSGTTTGGQARPATEARRSGSQAAPLQRAGQRRVVEGTIARSKQVGVKGGRAQHAVVLLRTGGGRSAVVDLGPVEALRDSGIRVESGMQLQAAGRVRRVGDRAVLFADRVKQGTQTASVERRRGAGGGQARAIQLGETRRIRGEVVDVKEVSAGEDRHTMVLLERRNGRQIAVDLGPTRGLDAEISVGTRIAVEGAPRRRGDRIVFEAERIQAGGRVAGIERDDRG